MPMHKGHWVPHSHCTVASGDCFYHSKCLGACTAARKRDHEDRIATLEHRVAELSRLVYPALYPRGVIAPAHAKVASPSQPLPASGGDVPMKGE